MAKRWPISQKKRTATYGAIHDEIMSLRIEITKTPGGLMDIKKIDDLLFELNKDIWRKVCAALEVPT